MLNQLSDLFSSLIELILGIEYKSLAVVISLLSFWYGFPTIWAMYFGDKYGFMESIRFWIKPDLFSLLKGKFMEDKWHELKLVAFPLTCIGWVIAVYKLIVENFT